MTDRETALCNLATKRTLLRAFEPVSSPEFMERLRGLVEEDEVKVRKANGLSDIPGFVKGAYVAPSKFDPHKVGEGVITNAIRERAASHILDQLPKDHPDAYKSTERTPLLLSADMAKIIEDGRNDAQKPYDHGYYSGVREGWAGAQRALQALLTSGELLTKEEHHAKLMFALDQQKHQQ